MSLTIPIVIDELEEIRADYDQIMIHRSDQKNGTYQEITDEQSRIRFEPDTSFYEYHDLEGTTDNWYKVSFLSSSLLTQSALSPPVKVQGMYCTVSDLRKSGIPETLMDPSRALHTIIEASNYIEQVTQNWFEPRRRSFRLECQQGGVLKARHPIIEIESIHRVFGPGYEMNEMNETFEEINLDEIVISNRHLTRGLLDPDDRKSPQIMLGHRRSFYPSVLKVQEEYEAQGWWGFTELGPQDEVGVRGRGGRGGRESQRPLSFGQTPALIRKACILLCVREVGLPGEVESREDWRGRARIKSERTRDQSYERFALSSLTATSSSTGDPEIDSILSMFSPSLTMGAV